MRKCIAGLYIGENLLETRCTSKPSDFHRVQHITIHATE